MLFDERSIKWADHGCYSGEDSSRVTEYVSKPLTRRVNRTDINRKTMNGFINFLSKYVKGLHLQCVEINKTKRKSSITTLLHFNVKRPNFTQSLQSQGSFKSRPKTLIRKTSRKPNVVQGHPETIFEDSVVTGSKPVSVNRRRVRFNLVFEKIP